MGIRKNAKFLTPTERESLVRAFVMMKADIVNTMAPPADRYSRWDQYVAIHRFIQSVNTPDNLIVNFGHGGVGRYGFLSWHRYFLYLLEQQLQSYVPGVMLPYWDWTDPTATILVADFLGPDGDPGSNDQVRQGYFAMEAPGTGVNATPAPAWWPAGLSGWLLHSAFGVPAGALRRNLNPPADLPSISSIRSVMAKGTLHDFQVALEAGVGTAPFHLLHNGLHGWFGAGAHMSSPPVSPFDPMFYLHHCYVDCLWAMWQMDGHATEFPMSGGSPHHHRLDPMYPWVGALSGYSSNFSFGPITMPDFTALGVITSEDVLDHRALGYSYDTQAVVGVALDRTGSMTGMTPDPMTTNAPDVTKWEAATRGVTAFLQDCETAYDAVACYVVAGVKTFRRLFANDFANVFSGTPYGLVKNASGYSSAAFESAVAGMTPGGSTPLADALVDAHTTLVTPPFGWIPADERRYLALLTDGLLTSGSPLASVANGSLTNTAVFAMGFGTAADVDYATLSALVSKGIGLSTQQVFQGESAGVIDKFYSQALAAAIGFTPVVDPVLELFEGEYTHVELNVTSAEEALFITAQGMDFEDGSWAYQLIGPDGHAVYDDGRLPLHSHGGASHGGHAGRHPVAVARRSNGRLSLCIQRDSADASAWVGAWSLTVAWRARGLDAMVMQEPGELLVPVAAGAIRGARYARLLVKPEARKAARAVPGRSRHRLDLRPTSTGSEHLRACSCVVNIYARTRLRTTFRPGAEAVAVGQPFEGELAADVLRGTVSAVNGFARLVAPAVDLVRLVRSQRIVPRAARLDTKDGLAVDSAVLLARLESRNPRLARLRDEELAVVSHHGGPPHVHASTTEVQGTHHVGLWLEGLYHPDRAAALSPHEGVHGAPSPAAGERFTRILSASIGAELPRTSARSVRSSRKQTSGRRRRAPKR